MRLLARLASPERRIAALLALVIAGLGPSAAVGHAETAPARSLAAPKRSVVSPDGRRVAEVRGRTHGGDVVWVGGRRVWPDAGEAGVPRIASELVWSRRSDAVAFLAHNRPGVVALVVIVVGDCTGRGVRGRCEDVEPSALAWPIPATAQPAHVVMWLGPSRVGAGPEALQPRVVASFRATTR